jgi:DNA-binding MarR family transcriptional regulator
MTSLKRPRILPIDPVAQAERAWIEHGWQEAAVGMAAVTSVMRVQQLLSATANKLLAPLGLTFSRYEVLVLLLMSETGALPLWEIGDRIQLHPASVTNLIHRLKRDRLLALRPNPDDKRGTIAALTNTGRGRAILAARELNENFFPRLGVQEAHLRSVVDVLTQLRQRDGDFNVSSWADP